MGFSEFFGGWIGPYGEIALLVLGFYLIEFQKITGVISILSRLYQKGMSYLSAPQIASGRGIKHQSLYEMMHSSRQFDHLISRDYFMSLFCSGGDYEKAFVEDLRCFLLLLKVHKASYVFVKQVMISHVMVAFLVGILGISFQEESWNFRGMILAMFLLQFVYVNWSKSRVFFSLQEDLEELAFSAGSEKKYLYSSHLKRLLLVLGNHKRALHEILSSYWIKKSKERRIEQSFGDGSEVQMGVIANVFLKQSTLKKDDAFFQVLQAVVMIAVFFVQNFT